MKNIFFLLMILCSSKFEAQPNCEAYKYYGKIVKYNACKKAEEANKFYQYSKEFQVILDQSIRIDSTYAYAYQQKSVAYLKSGDFITWKKLIDKAVKFNPKENLGYRGWCRYQFFRDYKGAIKDIEELDSLVKFDIGFSANGDYHLNIVKALCYSAIGEKKKAIQIINRQLNKSDYYVGLYDYLHLGVLYFEENNFEKAIKLFKKQSKENDLAENQYYSALTYKALKKEKKYKANLTKAKELYLQGRKMFDPYTNPMDKVFLENIESKIKKLIK